METTNALADKAVRNMVVLIDGEAKTNSRFVAEVFGREHKNVLQAYDNLDCSEEFSRLNFQPSNFMDARGKSQRMVDMTFDGFIFLIMGFTGARAAAFKEAYIAEFNRMRKILSQQAEERMVMLEKYVRLPILPLTADTRVQIKQLLTEGVPIQDVARICRASQKTVRLIRAEGLPTNQLPLPTMEGGAA